MKPIVQALIVALIAIAPCLALAQSPPATAPSSRWELKGIALGAHLEQVQALVSTLTCTTESFDAGLTTCRDPNAVLSDKPALLRVRLLDGKVVLVELANLRPKQTRAAAEALVKKFGPVSRITEATYRPAFGDHVVRDDKLVWDDGELQLIVNPLEPKTDGTFPKGAVVLLDVTKYDGEWLRRFRAKGQSSRAADAIGL